MYEQTKVGDGHSQSSLRRRRNTAYSRSLDDLTSVSVDGKYNAPYCTHVSASFHDIIPLPDNPAERWSSHSSLASDELLSQESREKELQVRDAELQDELLPITTTSVNEV